MKNRDGSISNGYFLSSDHREDLYVYGGWYKVGDGIAKDLGPLVYIKHLLSSRFKILYLRVKIPIQNYLRGKNL